MERSKMFREQLKSGDGGEYVVLASSCGDDTGGGLFAFDGNGVERIDWLSTKGLFVAGDKLLRLLWNSEEAGLTGELLVYDSRGIERYYRVDGISEPHDVIWDGEHFVIVSTLTNSVVWVDASGRAVRRWQAPGSGDAWHLNCLLVHDEQLFISAFGKFRRHREYHDRADKRTGFIHNITTGGDFVSGLSCPHTPRVFDGALVVCCSSEHEVLQIDLTDKRIRRQLKLDGWTRGIAVTKDLMLVGESAQRQDRGSQATANIVVASRETWEVLARYPLPCREIYDLVLAPAELVAGVRRGFRNNLSRAAEQEQYAMFAGVGVEPARLWATGDPLPHDSCRLRIEADLPDKLAPNEMFEFECRIENLGRAFFVSARPNPVYISYKWVAAGPGCVEEPAEGIRSLLPHALPPRRPTTCSWRLRTPAAEALYSLRLTLVQEGVAWFDELDEANVFCREIRIASSDESLCRYDAPHPQTVCEATEIR